MTLYNKRRCNPKDIKEGYYPEGDVKEFIRKLRDKLEHYEQGEVGTWIDKLAGKELLE